MRTPFEEVSVEPEEFFEHGDQIAVVVRARMRPKGSSAEIENRTGQLWTFRDGKVVSLRLFPKPEEALEAARLSE
jgi:ketosteroid isomerase-like protein